jgi:DNA-binding helix-hairpin-helix protein with protein kinase domain
MKGEVNDFGDFTNISLDEKKAQGGAGEIWTIKGHLEFVAKIYHPTTNLEVYEKKINAMIANRPGFGNELVKSTLYPECTWPVSAISDRGKFKGYIMPQIDFQNSRNLERFLQKKSRIVDGLSNFVGHRFNIAHNLALNVKKIHERHHLIVDLKPKNIMVQKEHLFVSILDTDGFKISSKIGEIYPAQQFTPDYIAPEFLKKRPQEVSIEQDLFALAVIIFRLINNGLHPFQSSMKRSSKTIQQMIEKRYYAYGLNGPGNLIPSKFSEHLYWPKEMIHAFDQAFRSRRRPSAQDWQNLLTKYTSPRFGLVSKCEINKHHILYNGVCAQCSVIAKLNAQSENKTKSSSFSKNRGLQKVRAASSKINKSTTKPLNQANLVLPTNPKHTVKRFKVNLIRKASVWTLIIFFTLTVSTDLALFKLSWTSYIEKRLQLHPFWSLFYLSTIFWCLYRFWRGVPARDCPNCGSYAGALKYQKSYKDFVKWKHQTKAGNPDKRYKSNSKLYLLTSSWICRHCTSNIIFQHQLSERPNRFTPIDTKRTQP